MWRYADAMALKRTCCIALRMRYGAKFGEKYVNFVEN